MTTFNKKEMAQIAKVIEALRSGEIHEYSPMMSVDVTSRTIRNEAGELVDSIHGYKNRPMTAKEAKLIFELADRYLDPTDPATVQSLRRDCFSEVDFPGWNQNRFYRELEAAIRKVANLKPTDKLVKPKAELKSVKADKKAETKKDDKAKGGLFKKK